MFGTRSAAASSDVLASFFFKDVKEEQNDVEGAFGEEESKRQKTANMTSAELTIVSAIYVDNYETYHGMEGARCGWKKKSDVLQEIVDYLVSEGHTMRTKEQIETRIKDSLKRARKEMAKFESARKAAAKGGPLPKDPAMHGHEHIQLIVRRLRQKTSKPVGAAGKQQASSNTGANVGRVCANGSVIGMQPMMAQPESSFDYPAPSSKRPRPSPHFYEKVRDNKESSVSVEEVLLLEKERVALQIHVESRRLELVEKQHMLIDLQIAYQRRREFLANQANNADPAFFD